MGIVLLELGEHAHAEGVLRRALELDPTDESARSRLVALLREEKRLEAAIELRREALLQTPADPLVWILLAQLLDETNETDDAATLLIYGDYLCPYCRRLRHVIDRLCHAMDDRLGYVFFGHAFAFAFDFLAEWFKAVFARDYGY
jgi:tetratricopeptide (TPR) repeat protein